MSDIRAFQIDALKTVLLLLQQWQITTTAQLNAVRGKKLLEEPLWKLIELDGKYGGAYISEGVKTLEESLGRRVSPSSGRWPESLLVARLGPQPNGRSWRLSPDHCCQLDHVVERRWLVEALLAAPQTSGEVLGVCLGCVVLRSEHRRLQTIPMVLRDPWQRYRTANPPLRVWSRPDERWVNLEPQQ